MRKTKLVTVADQGRDYGKVYLITEMPASKAEKWAARCFIAMARAGAPLPPNVAEAGIAGLFLTGIQSLAMIEYADAEPLLDEMFGCIQHIPDPAHPEVFRALVESDIEEVGTRVHLRAEVFALHTGFSSAAALWMSISATASVGSSTTPTSPAP